MQAKAQQAEGSSADQPASDAEESGQLDSAPRQQSPDYNPPSAAAETQPLLGDAEEADEEVRLEDIPDLEIMRALMDRQKLEHGRKLRDANKRASVAQKSLHMARKDLRKAQRVRAAACVCVCVCVCGPKV